MKTEEVLDDFAREIKDCHVPSARAKYMEARGKAVKKLAKSHRKDRPDREKEIAKILWDFKRNATSSGTIWWIDQILALMPDVEEAKREERERIKTAKVVCLCGSTRFTSEMLVKQWELTKQGYIVVSWCALPDNYFDGGDKTHIGDQEGVKEIVDEVHKRKIDLCDEVFILNIDGYIGESTASEIAYAKKIGRLIKYWQALRDEGGK